MTLARLSSLAAAHFNQGTTVSISTRASNRPLPLLLACAASVLASACVKPVTVTLPEPAPSPPSAVFRAGASVVDITPPPGAPLFGYAAFSAAPHANGYRTRLKARAVVLEGPAGGRIALVQADLGAVSRLLQQRVAAE